MKGTNQAPDAPILEVKKSSASAMPPPPADTDHESDLPIDRGYAWVIVLGCMFCNVICLGLQRAYGLLFVEFLHLYSIPVSIMSLVMSIQSACTSVSALLTQTVMLSLLSERQTIFIGGLCGGAGIILSYFASSIALLILTQSVLVGTANGMIMGPVQVIVSKYFHKRRSFAMACATLGGNLGAMVMPIFTELLLEVYGVRGALLILGAVFLNITVFAGLLRPLHHKKDTRAEARQLLTNAGTEEEGPQRGSTWSVNYDDGETDLRLHLPTPRHLLDTAHLWVSNPDIALAANVNLDDDDDNNDDDDIDDKHDSCRHILRHHDQNVQELQRLNNGSDTTTDTTHLNQVRSNDNYNYNHHHHHDHRDTDHNQDAAEPTTNSYMNKKKKKKKKKSACARFLSFFDFSLFKQPPFLLILVSCSLAFLPAALFGMYMPAMAADKGVVGQRAALLLTVFGGIGIFSRLGFGFLADKNLLRRSYLMALLLSLSCVAGLFTPFYNSYSLLIFFSVTYGLFGIVYFSLMPVVVVDLMGLHNMSKTLGFVQLFQGSVVALSHPIIGYLRDLYGHYHASYYFMSLTGLFCAFLLLFTPCVTRHRARSTAPPQEV